MNRYKICIENEDSADIYTKQDKMDNVTIDSQLEETSKALEEIAQGIEEGKQAINELESHSEVMTEANADAVQVAVEAMHIRLGMKNTKLATESYRTKVVALENFIADTGKKIIEAIKTLVRNFLNWISKFFGLSKDKIDKVEENIKDVKDSASEIHEEDFDLDEKIREVNDRMKKTREDAFHDHQVAMFMIKYSFLESTSIRHSKNLVDTLIKFAAPAIAESEKEIKEIDDIIKELLEKAKTELESRKAAPDKENNNEFDLLKSKVNALRDQIESRGNTETNSDVYYEDSKCRYRVSTGRERKDIFKDPLTMKQFKVSDLFDNNPNITPSDCVSLLSELQKKLNEVRRNQEKLSLMEKRVKEVEKRLLDKELEKLLENSNKGKIGIIKILFNNYINLITKELSGFINRFKDIIKTIEATIGLCELYIKMIK